MRIFSLIFVLAAAAFAQSADGLNVSVNRTVNIAADEAVFTVVAATTLEGTADQVSQVLQTAGIQNLSLTATGLGQTYSYPQTSDVLAFFQFTFTVPAANLKDAAKKLEAVRAAPPALLQSLQYSASVNASTAAVETARQTVLPQLLAEAQKKAQFLATSANLKLGPIKGVNESSYVAYALVGSWISTPQVFGSTSNSTNGGTQFTYYASVTFSLAP